MTVENQKVELKDPVPTSKPLSEKLTEKFEQTKEGANNLFQSTKEKLEQTGQGIKESTETLASHAKLNTPGTDAYETSRKAERSI